MTSNRIAAIENLLQNIRKQIEAKRSNLVNQEDYDALRAAGWIQGAEAVLDAIASIMDGE